LGLLLGALVDEERDPAELTPLVRPDPIGLGRESAPDRTGTLYLRINDSPAELADNQGEATVFIRQLLEK
jgi:hypothetical protein